MRQHAGERAGRQVRIKAVYTVHHNVRDLPSPRHHDAEAQCKGQAGRQAGAPIHPPHTHLVPQRWCGRWLQLLRVHNRAAGHT